MSTVNGVISSSYAADASDRVPTKTLTQTDFLKVMVAQLAQQDPFKAADSSKFMEDFMTMGNFQAMQDVSSNMSKMFNQSQSMFAQSLVGETVTISPDEGEPFNGVVDAAYLSNGNVMVTVNGADYLSTNITKILKPQQTGTQS